MQRRSFIKFLMLMGAVPLTTTHRPTRTQAESILVIGAGAAGLAAARKLHDSGYAVTVLEARNRIGGRVQSDYSLASHPIELGAEFIHGENVKTWELLRQYGLTAVDDVDDENIYGYLDNQLLNFEALTAKPHFDSFFQLEALAEAWVEDDNDDVSVGELLAEELPTLDPEMRQLFDHLLKADYGAGLEELGVYGLAELNYEGDGESDFRVADGYTRLMDNLAQGLTLRLNTPVTRVDWDETGVDVYTESGEMFSADKVIITLPLAILQAEDVEFTPDLPDWKWEAIEGLGAAHVDKLILKFKTPVWPADWGLMFTTLDFHAWWRPGWGRADEAPILTSLIGMAENLESLSESELIQKGLAELSQIFGRSDLAENLAQGRFINWGSDAYSKMGYSYVPVNGDDWRPDLAAPVDDVLFFAGEATHPNRAATVHGALESGYRAADEVMKA